MRHHTAKRPQAVESHDLQDRIDRLLERIKAASEVQGVPDGTTPQVEKETNA